MSNIEIAGGTRHAPQTVWHKIKRQSLNAMLACIVSLTPAVGIAQVQVPGFEVGRTVAGQVRTKLAKQTEVQERVSLAQVHREDGEDGPKPPKGPTQGPPVGIRYIVEAPFISQVPLRIVVGASVYARLCLYHVDPFQQLCVNINSPLPAGMDLEYTDSTLLDPNDDSRFLTFVPINGNSDPDGLAAQQFIEALSVASSVWGKYLQQHPQLVANTISSFRASSAGNTLMTGEASPRTKRSAILSSTVTSNSTVKPPNCYAEQAALEQCPEDPDPETPDDPDPNIPRVEIPGQRPPPYQQPPAPYELPPYEPMQPGGGGAQPPETQPPIGQYSKDKLLAQLTPVAPPCGKVGAGGLVCSVAIFGKRPPPLPPVQSEPIDRGRQYFAPQVLCDWHILCNEGQEPRDNDRGRGRETRGKTKDQLDEICVDINIEEINVCYAIIKAKRGGKGEEYYREIDMCRAEANKRMFACFETAKRLTGNGAYPAP